MKKIRESFRKKEKPGSSENQKSEQWQSDEAMVRTGKCQFQVKYLGAKEVSDSRGMQICEQALRVLNKRSNSRLFWRRQRHRVKAILTISADGVRVTDETNKGLIVDQTIEKVSFCAPDRVLEKGFSYICRDGATRRWMCHGFIATKDSGERLSHAVGCAFAACLEMKQDREKQCSVQASFNENKTVFEKVGSFRAPSLTEQNKSRSLDDYVPKEPLKGDICNSLNKIAIPRVHAPNDVFRKQNSFRMFSKQEELPFKRQLSLRVNELSETIERKNQMSTITEDETVFDPIPNSQSNEFGHRQPSNNAIPNSFSSPLIADTYKPTNENSQLPHEKPFNGQSRITRQASLVSTQAPVHYQMPWPPTSVSVSSTNPFVSHVESTSNFEHVGRPGNPFVTGDHTTFQVAL